MNEILEEDPIDDIVYLEDGQVPAIPIPDVSTGYRFRRPNRATRRHPGRMEFQLPDGRKVFAEAEWCDTHKTFHMKKEVI